MDVIKFVLWLATKLTLAVIGAVAFLLEKLTGHVRKRAQQGAPQQEPRSAYQAPASAPASATPAVHVHVHLDQMHAQPAPMPPPQSPMASVPPPPAAVLARPDHRIYVTTGSHLMQEHPACDDLLDRLDYVLYRAAHHDGEPFTVAPPLDEARHGRAISLDLPPVAAVDEGEFFSEERRNLPPPDGALWFRREGEAPQRLTTGTPS
jgi:hypothetical protein